MAVRTPFYNTSMADVKMLIRSGRHGRDALEFMIDAQFLPSTGLNLAYAVFLGGDALKCAFHDYLYWDDSDYWFRAINARYDVVRMRRNAVDFAAELRVFRDAICACADALELVCSDDCVLLGFYGDLYLHCTDVLSHRTSSCDTHFGYN